MKPRPNAAVLPLLLELVERNSSEAAVRSTAATALTDEKVSVLDADCLAFAFLAENFVDGRLLQMRAVPRLGSGPVPIATMKDQSLGPPGRVQALDLDGEHGFNQLFSQDLMHGTEGLQAALVQQARVVGPADHSIEIVQRQGYRFAFAGQLPEQRKGVESVIDVQAGGWLVEQDHVGLCCQAAGDQHALPLAAGQLVDQAISQMDDVGSLDCRLDRRHVHARRGFEAAEVRMPPHGDDIAHCESEVDAGVLRHKGDAARQLPPGQRVEPLTTDGRTAFGRTPQAGKEPQDGRLARAIRADQCGDAPGQDFERHVADQPAAVDPDSGAFQSQTHR